MFSTRIGEIVRYHRKKAGLTQHQLANLAGLGKTVVFDVEKGKLSIQYDTLLKILAVFNITTEFRRPLMSKFAEQNHEES